MTLNKNLSITELDECNDRPPATKIELAVHIQSIAFCFSLNTFDAIEKCLNLTFAGTPDD